MAEAPQLVQLMQELVAEQKKMTQAVQLLVQSHTALQQTQKGLFQLQSQANLDLQHELWYSNSQLEMLKIQEHRQSLNTPDVCDAWRHGDQVASGEIWSGTPGIWQTIAKQISQNIVSKGQLPAECDLRRGQYKAVHELLKYEGRLALTPGTEPWAQADAEASQD